MESRIRPFGLKSLVLIGLLSASLAMTGCSGDDGAAGDTGDTGATGETGDTGDTGPVTQTEESCVVCHGAGGAYDVATLHDVDAYVANYDVAITDVALTTAGTTGMVVNFTVTDGAGNPVAAIPGGSVNVNLSKLVQTPATDIYTWQNYYNSLADADGVAGATPVMAKAIQASGKPCTIGAGAGVGEFTCTVTTNFSAVTSPLAVTWQPALTHRVALYYGSHLATGQPGNGWADFVPSTLITTDFAAAKAAVADTRDIATTASCNECHGKLSGHGGDRVEVAICVTCHNPGTTDPDSGLTMDMANMVHSMHLGNKAGTTVATGAAHPAITGENGAVLRATDYIVGHRGSDNNFSEIGFPNRLDNCTKCHTAADAATPDGDNPMTVSSIKACVSCHDATSWTASHAGRTDASCTYCHSGTLSVAATHNFATTDYTTTIGITAPENGTYYVAGEAPLVTVTVKDGASADVGDYTGQDYNATTNPTATYNDATLYVYGPRAKAVPVLTTGSSTDPVAPGMSQGHNLWTGGTDAQVMTDATGYKYQLLTIPADMTPGTYMVMARIGLGSDTNERAWALKTIQIGQTAETLKVAGDGCADCHYLADYSSTAHRAYFGTDGCLACHDQSGGHADYIANRVHAVHAASALSDLTPDRDWTEVTYPQEVSHCLTCHDSGNTSYQTNPLGFACIGCHGDTEGARDHMIQNGADFPAAE